MPDSFCLRVCVCVCFCCPLPSSPGDFPFPHIMEIGERDVAALPGVVWYSALCRWRRALLGLAQTPGKRIGRVGVAGDVWA